MSGLDSSDEEELALMHHIQTAKHSWKYSHQGRSFEDGDYEDVYVCTYPGCGEKVVKYRLT